MKKITLTLNIFLIIIISVILIYSKNNDKILNSVKDNKNNMLSIMVEKEAGTGNYEETTNFPSTGYYLNKKLSKCVNGSKLSFSEGNLIIKGNKSDRCYAYFDKDKLGSICKGQNMAECFIKNYKKDSAIIYHDGKVDYDGMMNYELEAGDLSYRYTGSYEEVNNYVCLNNKEIGNCEHDDLYRVIGLFKNKEDKYEIKLIKADYTTVEQTGGEGIGDYNSYYNISNYWYNAKYKGNLEILKIAKYFWNNKTKTNKWLESDLNNINLNQVFFEYIVKRNPYLENLIQNHDWVVGGNTMANIYIQNAKNTYEAEILNSSDNLIDTKKIGLMYVSDYYYAASSKHWSKIGESNTADDSNNYISAIDDNWLYLGLWEWTITGCTNHDLGSFTIYPEGGVSMVTRYYPDSHGERAVSIRPTFYLSSNTLLQSGNGKKENPYRIAYKI